MCVLTRKILAGTHIAIHRYVLLYLNVGVFYANTGIAGQIEAHDVQTYHADHMMSDSVRGVVSMLKRRVHAKYLSDAK